MTTANGLALAPEGSIGASLAAINTTIPGYQSQLSDVANALAGNMNTLQAAGMDAAGDPGSAIAGGFAGTILPNIFVDGGSTTTYTASATRPPASPCPPPTPPTRLFSQPRRHRDRATAT